MGVLVLPKDAEFDDDELARGTDVRANDQAVRDFLNDDNIGTDNITKTDAYPWTGIHSWTINNSGATNQPLIVSAVMAAGFYGRSITSSAAQTNSPLEYAALTNTSSTSAIKKYVQSGSGPVEEAEIRTVTGFVAPYVAKSATTATVVTNTAVETPFSDLTLSLPANFLKAGNTIKGTVYGSLTRGVGANTGAIYVKWGGISGTPLLFSGAATVTTLTNSAVKLDFLLTCKTVGATGTMEAQGVLQWLHDTNLDVTGMGAAGTGGANTSEIVINTTTANDLVVSFTWGTASATAIFMFRSGYLELLK